MHYLNSVKEKIFAVDCLRFLKESKTFRELSKELNLPIGVLNRYINGYVLPKSQRASEIIDLFYKSYYKGFIQDLSKNGSNKLFITYTILSRPKLLNFIAGDAAGKFNTKIDKVITSAVNGIPLAVKIADYLDCDSVYVKKKKEIALSDYYVSNNVLEDKPTTTPFYLPKHLLKKKDGVLIIDDVIRSGSTVLSLINICEQANVNIVGIFAVFITKSAYQRFKKDYKTEYVIIGED
ncbi:adenine phosphoribosyltransferase [Candidatus Woesearchaeota archaeon]|mgnify:CR=1 FL=1|nr:adenine phosphoribosyltransferase [Candidatus Woesearchaeota archaeon]|tara:strand:- start:10071 stop:10778 length:708 start_codon:yes stop_codon:yes gene_type:complete